VVRVAQVVSVNISEKKGTVKKAVPEIRLRLRHGIEGDAHAGDWHRQISLLAEESADKMRALLPDLQPGAFAENINTRGVDLKRLPVGTRLRLGETVVEVTQIGKQCHSGCEIKKATGACVMPTEGIFAVVVREGRVRKGDPIEILGEGET
jgi:MOSC domain-containing protein YiiM